MRWLMYVGILVMVESGAAAAAVELALAGYQRPEGAITVRFQGDTVDPYFAAKALLSARDAGLDARQAARAWIRWLLPFQRPDGGFDRFCLKDGRFLPCAPADADDAMAAVWIELLARFALPAGLPNEWRKSLTQAERNLSTLRDHDTGVYQISSHLPVALLMDNLEVYSALKAMREFHNRRGEFGPARTWAARADKLAQSIQRTFWDPAAGFRVSTQNHDERGFYPDQVAQVFSILTDLTVPEASNAARYAFWMKANREAWLRQGETDYPWGLVALAAHRMGDREAVRCWCARAVPLRHGKHWNVLEEAIYLAFEAQFQTELTLPACGS